MNERVCIIGGDAAGMSAAARLKRRKPELEIEVFEGSDQVSYAACGIPYFIGGEIGEVEELVVVRAEEFVKKRGILVRLRHRVEKILPAGKLVVVKDLEEGQEKEARYDHLLIATGARPVVPAGLDLELPGVFALRGLREAERLRRFLEERSPKTAVIVGAGYLGLEMAEALTARGLSVTAVEFLPRVVPAMEEEISARAAHTLAENGVETIVGAGVQSLTRRGDRLFLALSTGRELKTELVVLAVGVVPNAELAAEAGLELGVRGAIAVNRRQQTSAPQIWAAGDCCEAYHRLLKKNVYLPLALTANRQGRIVADNLAGIPAEFPGILGIAVFKLFDLTIARTGLGSKEAQDHGRQLIKTVVSSRSRAHYYPGNKEITTVLLTDPQRKKLWGAQMAGKEGVAQRINTFAAALAAGLSLQQIFDLDLAYAPPFSPVWDPVLQAAEVAMKK